MSASTTPPGFALRGEALKEANRMMNTVASLDRERRIRRLVTVGGGWVMAVLMGGVAAAALGVMWVRPVPRDRVYVAILHDDGSYDAPVAREDLPASRREVLFRYSVVQYVKARENYSWEGVNGNYRRVSAMSTPAERDRYQATMLDRRNPENPAVLYGDGLNAAIADITAIQVRTDPASPNAVDAVFLVKITAPNQAPRTIRKTARLTWLPAEDRIPPEVQQEFDPLAIAFSHYSSTPDPGAAQ